MLLHDPSLISYLKRTVGGKEDIKLAGMLGGFLTLLPSVADSDR